LKRVLVTGGAGYIGSHTSLQLVEAGHQVVVLDNLYSGHRWAVPDQAGFVHGDIADQALVADTIQLHQIDAVIHFAGHIVVPESVENPAKYYHNNVVGSLNLIETCIDCGVGEFVFSSSAAVYGNPNGIPGSTSNGGPISESTTLSPINPYGTSKLITEWTLRDLAAATKGRFRYVALRYFNVAGAHLDGKLGQATPEATHLIKVACEAACGIRDGMSIFGDDYPTPDGTCIRDYIHVDDLARAHLDALDYMDLDSHAQAAQGIKAGGIEMNCGYGNGYSVKQVIECVKTVSKVDFPVKIEPPRAGDPPQLVADNSLIRQRLGWNPRYNDLMTICRTAFEWEQALCKQA